MINDDQKNETPATPVEVTSEVKVNKAIESLEKNLCDSYKKLFKFIEKMYLAKVINASAVGGTLNFKRWKLDMTGLLSTFDNEITVDISKGHITKTDVANINLFLMEELGF